MLFKSNESKEDYILKYYENLKIKNNQIILENAYRNGLEGSIYYILIELCTNPEYRKFKKYIVIHKNKINNFYKAIKNKKLNNLKILEYDSQEYYKKLYESKYLINDNTFSSNFIKKEGQVYINIVDKIPLVNVGRANKINPHAIGKKQRNFLMSDYIVCPNKRTLEIIRKDYMLDNIYSGKYIVSGLPKNDIFFSEEQKEKLKKKINVDNKNIIVYAPTYRGKAYLEEQEKRIKEFLQYLDNNIDNNYLVYFKPDNKMKIQIDFEKYKNIVRFPKIYELNEILSISDVFITDYSSSIFDYSLTNNQIISYSYDMKTFKEKVGFYFDINSELGVMATDVKEEAINQIKRRQKFENTKIKQYMSIEKGKSTSNFAKILLNNKKDLQIIDANVFNNGKENVIIFTGSLIKNGITASLKGLINNIDLNKRNYYLTFFEDEVKKNKYLFFEFPKDIKYISIEGERIINQKEGDLLQQFFEENVINNRIQKTLENVYKREIKRIYPKVKFDYAIDFCGYNKEIINLFRYMNSIKMRYTHSNLKEEYKTRQNIHLESLKLAYKSYDKIIAVREGMEEEINTLFDDIKPNKVKIVHNLNNIQDIQYKSRCPIEFQEKTYSNITKEELGQILNNKGTIKFINISRFSKEKGLERLINAFDKFCKQNKLQDNQAYLIIIGGHGKEFENICNMIRDMNLNNVIIIRNVQNPLTILKRCNLYILSSYYEGLPMTVMESLILDIPVISVDIIGPRPFFSKGYVYLVSDSEDGIIEGMNSYLKGNIKDLKKFDAEEFNKKALREFEDIF